MNLEETLAEDIESHPEIKESAELVQLGLESWEGTDHFQILYGSKMMGDAGDDSDVLQENKNEFWEGYLTGRKAIGIDIYAKAKKLLAAKRKKTLKASLHSSKRKQERVGKQDPSGIQGVRR